MLSKAGTEKLQSPHADLRSPQTASLKEMACNGRRAVILLVTAQLKGDEESISMSHKWYPLIS